MASAYDVLPVNRDAVIGCIHCEQEAARRDGLSVRILVPLTRGPNGAALQFEVELNSLDQLDEFRQCGVGSAKETGNGMREFSEMLERPPEVEILRLDDDAS